MNHIFIHVYKILDEIITFRDVYVECDGKDCTNQIKWTTAVQDANCNMAAHVNQTSAATSISITWDTSAPSKYDKMTRDELVLLNKNSGGVNGWARSIEI